VNAGVLEGRRILITGASGYIGSWLAEYAREEGADVRITLRDQPAHLREWASKFEVVPGDVSKPESLAGACRDREIVWHAASANELVCKENLAQGILINVYGTANVLEAAVRAQVKAVVKLSTFHVYAANIQGVITEESTAQPRSGYGLSNFMGDLAAASYQDTKSCKVMVARLSNGYGAPRFKQTSRWSLILNDLSRMAFEKREVVLKGSGHEQRDFVAIRDIFRALLLMSVQPHKHNTFNVGGDNSRSTLEVAHLVKLVHDRRYGTNIPIIIQGKQPEGKPARIDYDISRLRELGYSPEDRMIQEIERIFTIQEAA